LRLLLDTHVLLCALSSPERLSPATASALAHPSNEVFVSAASAWEIAIKQSLKKLDLPAPAAAWLPNAVAQTGFTWIPITPEDALRVGKLPWHHRDPFDRLLVAQASGGYTLVSRDARLSGYGIPLLPL
jgi:PIN domain nuclease of toxin-antitoxin system